MIHIIIPKPGYFPKTLTADRNSNKRVVILADPDGMIPVSAYLNKDFTNPEVVAVTPSKTPEVQRMKLAFMIGKIAGENEYTVYTDDQDLAAAVKPATSSQRTAKKKTPINKTASSKETIVSSERTVSADISKQINPPVKKEEKKKTAKKADMSKSVDAAKVRKVIGDEAYDKYAEVILGTFKTSTKVTFAMNLRMALAKEGAKNEDCKEIAAKLENAFLETLP